MTVYVVYESDFDGDRIITATHSKSLANELAEKFGAMVTPYDNAEFLRNKIWEVGFDKTGSVQVVFDRSNEFYLYDKNKFGKVKFIENTFGAYVIVMCEMKDEAIDVAKQLYKTAVFAKVKRRKK